jgi:hypothetical protein
MKQEDYKERQTREARAMAQQIRRNMITRVRPSGKIYSRRKSKEIFS